MLKNQDLEKAAPFLIWTHTVEFKNLVQRIITGVVLGSSALVIFWYNPRILIPFVVLLAAGALYELHEMKKNTTSKHPHLSIAHDTCKSLIIAATINSCLLLFAIP